MPDVQEHTVVRWRTHAAYGMTALFDALRKQAHGLALGLFRVRANRLEMTQISVMSVKGRANITERYRRLPDTPCRVLIYDAGITNGVYMDVESLAFLLDAAISSDPTHFLRKPQADKDTDD
jgi:hypothetical protein